MPLGKRKDVRELDRQKTGLCQQRGFGWFGRGEIVRDDARWRDCRQLPRDRQARQQEHWLTGSACDVVNGQMLIGGIEHLALALTG